MAFQQPRWAYPLHNLQDYTAFVPPAPPPIPLGTDEVNALSEDVDALRLQNQSRLILRDVSRSKLDTPLKHHPSQDLVTALHLGGHVNQYFRPYVDAVGPEDAVRSDPAPQAVDTKAKIRAAVVPAPKPVGTSVHRKLNPYAKYWERPVGQSQVNSKVTTKDDMPEALTKRPVQPPKPMKPKSIIKASTTSTTVDGGASHKRSASGAGLDGQALERGPDGKEQQKGAQKRKRTIDPGMPKMDKGYTHLIPDCIDPLPTGDDKERNRIFRDLLSDLLYPPPRDPFDPPPPDEWSTKSIQPLPLDFFMQKARIPAGIVVEGYKPGTKDGVEASETVRRNKRNKRDKLLQNALERFTSPQGASSPAAAPSPGTPGPAIAPPRLPFMQSSARKLSIDVGKSNFPGTPSAFGKSSKPQANRPGPYDRPPNRPGTPGMPGTPGTPRLPGQLGHKNRGATQPPPSRQPGTPLVGSYDRRPSGTKRPADEGMQKQGQKKAKPGTGSRSESPMPRQQAGQGLGQGAPRQQQQPPGGKHGRSGTAGP